ncbi:hypothetical protein BRC69_05950 [Halobacteriales archaeon QH_6_66_25]|nr:MAG: hypothetical protein BRC69_05950 [Halobacteriales archaeon QH_6_66_25]
MTGIATGGFSVYAESIGHYDSPLIEYATVPVMVQANANPLIVEELREWRGNAIPLTDKKLHDVLDDLWSGPNRDAGQSRSAFTPGSPSVRYGN